MKKNTKLWIAIFLSIFGGFLLLVVKPTGEAETVCIILTAFGMGYILRNVNSQ